MDFRPDPFEVTEDNLGNPPVGPGIARRYFGPVL